MPPGPHAQQLHGGGLDEPALAESPQARCGDRGIHGKRHRAGCRMAAMRNAAFGPDSRSAGRSAVCAKAGAHVSRLAEPQAEATLQSSVIAYENNQTDLLDLLDSQMTVIDVDLAWFQSMADFDTRLADLELAVGAHRWTSTTAVDAGGETMKTASLSTSTCGILAALRLACRSAWLFTPASRPFYSTQPADDPVVARGPETASRPRPQALRRRRERTGTRPRPDFAAALAGDWRHHGGRRR